MIRLSRILSALFKPRKQLPREGEATLFLGVGGAVDPFFHNRRDTDA